MSAEKVNVLQYIINSKLVFNLSYLTILTV